MTMTRSEVDQLYEDLDRLRHEFIELGCKEGAPVVDVVDVDVARDDAAEEKGPTTDELIGTVGLIMFFVAGLAAAAVLALLH